MNKRLIAFPYYGGKNNQLGWLLPLIPYTKKYVEPFGGSAAVLLNRERSSIEIYNDVHKEVVNFFKILRTRKDELIDLLYLTPYARAEFEECLSLSDDPLERARRWFVLARQSFMGNNRTWATSHDARAGWSMMTSRWLSGISKLSNVSTRITGVVIECRPALQVIEKYDDIATTMYLDPPYPFESRKTRDGYDYEMTTDDHKDLLNTICVCESNIAISSYENDLYLKYLKGWHIFKDKVKQLAGPRGLRQETVFMNYNPKEIRHLNQSSLEDF